MYENFVGAEETVCIGEPSIPRGSSVYSLYKRVYPLLEKINRCLLCRRARDLLGKEKTRAHIILNGNFIFLSSLLVKVPGILQNSGITFLGFQPFFAHAENPGKLAQERQECLGSLGFAGT